MSWIAANVPKTWLKKKKKEKEKKNRYVVIFRMDLRSLVGRKTQKLSI